MSVTWSELRGSTRRPPVGALVRAAVLQRAALLATSAGEPLYLLDALLGIAGGLGRHRGPDDVRWGPRTIDLDLLWIEGMAMESDRLVVGHPHLTERAPALRPLVDVEPDAIDPISQPSVHAPFR